MRQILKILFKYRTENSDEYPSQQIVPCLEELGSRFKKKNIHFKIVEYPVISKSGVKVNHANLIAYNPKFRAPYILFQGHLDTVPVVDAYRYNITANRLQGRGAVDMKGSVAAMIKAFEILYHRSDLKYPPALLITGDEEANNFKGIRFFLRHNKLSFIFSINGEPTNLTVATKLRGVAIYELEKRGRSGHSASENNDHLIESIIPLMIAIQKYLRHARRIKNTKFGSTIAALTICNAGIKANQLPDKIRISFNLRTVTLQRTYDRLFHRLVSPYLSSGISLKDTSLDPIEVSLDSDIINKLRRAFIISKLKFKRFVNVGITEASFMNNEQIPTIVCGPGSLELAHGSQEKEVVMMKDLYSYSTLLQEIVKQF